MKSHKGQGLVFCSDKSFLQLTLHLLGGGGLQQLLCTTIIKTILT